MMSTCKEKAFYNDYFKKIMLNRPKRKKREKNGEVDLFLHR